MVKVGMAIANVPQDMVIVYVDMLKLSLGMVNVSYDIVKVKHGILNVSYDMVKPLWT
jgi:hypothetical protein